MKLCILLLCLLSTLLAQDKEKVTLGLGAYTQSQPYSGVDTLIIPSPVMFFDNSVFYIRWTRVGLYFLGEKNDSFAWGLSLTAQPKPFGYGPSDIQGMNERQSTWEAGLAFSASLHDARFELLLLHDILDRYNAHVIQTEITYDFTLGDFSFYPSFIAVYQSENFLNYYYGIQANEANSRGQNIYVPSSGIQYGIQSFIQYPFTTELSALVNLRIDRLPSQASASPLVNDKYLFSGLASLIYTFEY